MMGKKGEVKKQRIITYYALAIVLPCLILGFLALRGIQNDQALVEREQRRDLLEAGQQVIRETDEQILTAENNFINIASTIPAPQKTLFNDSLLTRFISQHHAIAGILYLSGNGPSYLLDYQLMYVPDEFSSPSYVVISPTVQDVFEKGWEMEFREKKYTLALQYYQDVLSNATNEQTRGEILNAVARIQKKLSLDDQAIETYDLIWDDCPDALIQNDIPLGAVALLEKSLLCMGIQDTSTALHTIHLLLTQLQKNRWEMRYSSFINFISKADEVISFCENFHNQEIQSITARIHALKDSLSSSINRTDYLLALAGNNEITSHNSKLETEAGKHRYKTQINEKFYYLSLIPANDQGIWGLITDQDEMLNNCVYPSISKSSNNSTFCWEIRDINGTLLLHSGNIPEDMTPVNVAFPPDLPSWSLSLYPENSGLMASLFRSGEGLFLYIFVAILIVLAFGLFFTLQAVNHELHLSKMKSNFMSTVSHEFKSPLTSIRQLAEMLVHRRVQTTERQQKYYTTILQQSERLSHLIDNILDFSKMEEGQKLFHFEKANIASVVKDIVESFQYQVVGQGFAIDLSVPESIPDVVFDREAMEQVMHNLLDNAIKYSGDSRKIEVYLQLQGSMIMICVRDDGVGIRKEEQDKVFSRFYRAGDELTQTVKGSGIGLTIVKQIIEAHQGEITVESSPGKGSIFCIKLPIYQA